MTSNSNKNIYVLIHNIKCLKQFSLMVLSISKINWRISIKYNMIIITFISG